MYKQVVLRRQYDPGLMMTVVWQEQVCFVPIELAKKDATVYIGTLPQNERNGSWWTVHTIHEPALAIEALNYQRDARKDRASTID